MRGSKSVNQKVRERQLHLSMIREKARVDASEVSFFAVSHGFVSRDVIALDALAVRLRIRVIRRDLGENVSGMATQDNRGHLYALLNRSVSVEEQRVLLAHLLGHLTNELLVTSGVGVTLLEPPLTDRRSDVEVYAEAFSAQLLLGDSVLSFIPDVSTLAASLRVPAWFVAEHRTVPFSPASTAVVVGSVPTDVKGAVQSAS